MITDDDNKTQAERDFKSHVDEHGCGCPYRDRPGCPSPEKHAEGHKIGGIAHCKEAARLFALMPEDKKAIFG